MGNNVLLYNSEKEFPIKPVHREQQLKLIESAVQSFISERRPVNLFIHGKSGTGKTTFMKYVLSQIYAPLNVTVVYLNCHEYQTKTAIYTKIAEKLGNSFSIKGFGSHEIFSKIRQILSSENKNILLVLDNSEALSSKLCDVLYPMLDEISGISIFIISNNLKTLELLDDKIKSSFMFTIVEFQEYLAEQIRDILGSLARVCLIQNSYESDILDKIADLGATNSGNARFSIKFLFEAAKNAQDRNSTRIELLDIESVSSRIFPLQPNGHSLTQEEQIIVDILKENELTSSQLYEFLLKRLTRSKRQVRNYLSSLVSKGYLEFETLNCHKSNLKPKLFRLKKR
ncbi:AAA family ATPase [Candidatus Micrarchaeota archaeon]|nr:AAA family ATPase [Candidatus Micrarchaeota archaeon]